MIILVLLFFVVGPPYLDPPMEYGVAVNFGNSEVGSGNIQPTKPIKSEPREEVVKEESKVEEVQPTEPTTTSEPAAKAENLLTEESPEAIAIKKQKAAEAKAKAEAERKEQQRKAAEEQKRRAEAEKKKKLDALIGGVKTSEGSQTGGEGPDSSAGDKGQQDGNPYAPSYFGGSGPGKGGIGYGLGGRGRPTRQIYKQDCNEYGLVVVRIEVNQQGGVVSAEPGIRGTTNTHPCLLEPAKKIAMSHKWPSDPNAPSRQIGFVSINFDLSQ